MAVTTMLIKMIKNKPIPKLMKNIDRKQDRSLRWVEASSQ